MVLSTSRPAMMPARTNTASTPLRMIRSSACFLCAA